MRWVADSVAAHAAAWVRYDALRSASPVWAVIAQAARTGAPAGPLLRAEAASARVRAHADLERAAERLGVRILVPLGVCVLPAFVVLGVVPVLLSMLGGLDVA